MFNGLAHYSGEQIIALACITATIVSQDLSDDELYLVASFISNLSSDLLTIASYRTIRKKEFELQQSI